MAKPRASAAASRRGRAAAPSNPFANVRPWNNLIQHLGPILPEGNPLRSELLTRMSDSALNEDLRRMGVDPTRLAEMRRYFDETCNNIMASNNGVPPIVGALPAAGDMVYLIDIPNSDVIIRLSDGGLVDGCMFLCMFVKHSSQKTVNTPEGWTLSLLKYGPGSEADSVVLSWERAMGIAPEDLMPGQEKCNVLEGRAYRVRSPSRDLVEFIVPTRPQRPIPQTAITIAPQAARAL